MSYLKKLKSFDLESLTIMGTSIDFIWGIIIAIILLVYIIIGTGIINISIFIMALATAFLTLIISIPKIFGAAFLYNILINKLMDINVEIKNMDEITNISIIPTATIVAIISLIIWIVLYPILFVVISILYPILSLFVIQGSVSLGLIGLLLIDPLSLVYAFVVPFFSIIIASFVFNKVTPFIGGIKVSLGEEGDKTALNHVNPISVGIISGIIYLVLALIIGLIISIIVGNLPAMLMIILILAIGGLASGFICGTLCSFLYNVLSKKLGVIKLGLEDIE